MSEVARVRKRRTEKGLPRKPSPRPAISTGIGGIESFNAVSGRGDFTGGCARRRRPGGNPLDCWVHDSCVTELSKFRQGRSRKGSRCSAR